MVIHSTILLEECKGKTIITYSTIFFAIVNLNCHQHQLLLLIWGQKIGNKQISHLLWSPISALPKMTGYKLGHSICPKIKLQSVLIPISKFKWKFVKPEWIPEIAGVTTPSPMTIQVPINAKTSNTFCKALHFSRADFTLAPIPLWGRRIWPPPT